MNLFMWFKLEELATELATHIPVPLLFIVVPFVSIQDAQQSLYKTKCDMNARKYVLWPQQTD